MSPFIEKRTICDVMESVFLSVNDHLTSVGEELVDALCVLQLQERRRHHVRLLVLQRLRVAAQWMCSLVQRELQSLLEADPSSKLHVETTSKLQAADDLLHLPLFEEELSPKQPQDRRSWLVQEESPPPPALPHIKEEQQERRSSLVREEPPPPPPPPHIKEEQQEEADILTVTTVQMRCNIDSDSLLPAVCKRERRGLGSPRCEEEEQVEMMMVRRSRMVQEKPPRSPPPRCRERRRSSEEQEEPQAPPHRFPEEPKCLRHEEESSMAGILVKEEEETWSPRGSLPSTTDLHLPLHRPETSSSSSTTFCSVAEEHGVPEMGKASRLRLDTQARRSCQATSPPAMTTTTTRPSGFTRTFLNNVTAVGRGGEGGGPFSCPVCGKDCSQSGLLKTHMRSHTGEKPFVCAVCGKGCADAGGLRSHMKTHTAERPFVCGVCGKGCSRKNDLKIHLRTHTGERPCSCALCGKSFVHVGHLRRHMKTHLSF